MSHPFNLFVPEDEPGERQPLSFLVRKCFPGWHASLIANSGELVVTLQELVHSPQKASLLLVDMYLPGSDGTDVLRQVS